MSFLSFLKTAEVELDPKEAAAKRSRSKQWNPNPTIPAIRVWADGSVFPSQSLVDKFDLEYKDAAVSKVEIPLKEGQDPKEQKFKNEYTFITGPGNGFDVIDSRNWGGYQASQHMLFISPIEKGEKKVDLFTQVGRDEEGKPKVSVMEQGTKTFGSEVLVPAIEALYGIKLSKDPGDVEYVDMVVFEEADGVNITEKLSKDIALFPKLVSRGDDKGKADYVRREKAKVYGFVPASLLYGENEPKESDSDDEEDELSSALSDRD